jgi:DNA polymerase
LQAKRTGVIHDLQEYLRFLDELGVDFVLPVPRSGKESKHPPSGLRDLDEEIRCCEGCPLFKSRTHAVPGEGNVKAELMFVGEGPGYDEDLQGRPFVGRAGQLLTRIIGAMGFAREDVYITNVVKCRPPNNRNPHSEEIAACAHYLQRQLAEIKPRIIVSLGNVPTQFFLDTRSGITSLRGNFHSLGDILVMPTFHPSYLVRNEQNRELKRKVWEDMKMVMAQLGRR